MYTLPKNELPALLALWSATHTVYAPSVAGEATDAACDTTPAGAAKAAGGAAPADAASATCDTAPVDAADAVSAAWSAAPADATGGAAPAGVAHTTQRGFSPAAAPVQLVSFSPDTAVTFDYINFYKPVPDFSKSLNLFDWEQEESGIRADPSPQSAKKRLYFGVRPCDAVALAVQDTFHLTEYIDPVYASQRNNILIVAMNCNRAGDACFCTSTNSGPFLGTTAHAADVVVTELADSLVFEPVTIKGKKLFAQAEPLFLEKVLHLGDAKQTRQVKAALREKALASFTRFVNLQNIHTALPAQYSGAFWKEAGARCISCSGCTQLCPTCTCFQVLEDATEQKGTRIRVKDTCQSEGFTRNAGWHNPRTRTDRVRYRIYDKLSYVETRFGVQGCVGCGRCSVTCPVHIDIVALATKVQEQWAADGKPQPLMPPVRYEKRKMPHNDALYTPRAAVLTGYTDETKDIRRYFFHYCDAPDEPVDLSGQFYMLTVFGVGEIAISIPFGDAPGTVMEFCVKKMGKVTSALASLQAGDIVGLRGPYGRGFPVEYFEGRDVLIVGSGVGLAPVRTAIVRMLDNREKFGKIAIIASATRYEGLVYTEDLKKWATEPDVQVMYALAKPTAKVNAHVGYINDLLPALPFAWQQSAAILCASPRRIKAVASDLLTLGMEAPSIFTSLETHMRCGIGKCGHCKVGSHYMCVDGPVFNYEEMLALPPEF